MDKLTCAAFRGEIDEYLDGDLDSATRSAFEGHASSCTACARSLRVSQSVRRALAALPVEGPRTGFWDAALQRAQRSRGSRLAAVGFIGAFGLSVLTVVLSGLAVHAPRQPVVAAAPAVTLKLDQPRTVNLVFDSHTAIDSVQLTVELPRGVELRGHDGARRVEWDTRLVAGSNLLPLEVVATSGRGGQLVARLKHGTSEKTFLVNLSIDMG